MHGKPSGDRQAQGRRRISDGSASATGVIAQVGMGYLKRTDLTLQRFVRHGSLGLCFRTGDIARAAAAGLELVGRKDSQVLHMSGWCLDAPDEICWESVQPQAGQSRDSPGLQPLRGNPSVCMPPGVQFTIVSCHPPVARQVKLAGQRIELGEIEEVIAASARDHGCNLLQVSCTSDLFSEHFRV